MKLLKRLNIINQLKKINIINTTVTSDLVKKTDYNTKISKIEKKINHDHDNYITTQEFNKLTSDNFTAKIKQVNLARKNGIADFVKKDRF